MQPNATDKTRSEDARAVLQKLEDEERAIGRTVFADLIKAHKDTHYPPPKPEPVWRKGVDEYEWAIVAGELRWRSGNSSGNSPSLTANLVCQLAADYYAQLCVTVPEEARRAYDTAYYEFKSACISDGQRAGLEAALPHLLAANQPQQRKPKAVQWALIDRYGNPVRRVFLSAQGAEVVRAKEDETMAFLAPHRVLALVEPEEVLP